MKKNEMSPLRKAAKEIVLAYMAEHAPGGSEGLKTAEIFRECGFDWGDYPNASSSQQQFWVAALLRELEKEGKVQRDPDTKCWRLL